MLKILSAFALLLVAACVASYSPRSIADVVQMASVTLDDFCSGVLIAEDKVLTAAHCTDYGKDREFKIKVQDKWLIAKLQRMDTQRDLAILTIPGVHLKGFVQVAKQDVRLGDDIWCVGNPGGKVGFNDWLSKGIVSRLNTLDPFTKVNTLTDITCGIHGGSSGGGMFNLSGKLVGIVSQGMIVRGQFGSTQFGTVFASAQNWKAVTEFLNPDFAEDVKLYAEHIH